VRSGRLGGSELAIVLAASNLLGFGWVRLNETGSSHVLGH
jgi:hypothetical protein